MAGRPPKEDSRDKQYRVRLNDAEDEMLSFAVKRLVKPNQKYLGKLLKRITRIQSISKIF